MYKKIIKMLSNFYVKLMYVDGCGKKELVLELSQTFLSWFLVWNYINISKFKYNITRRIIRVCKCKGSKWNFYAVDITSFLISSQSRKHTRSGGVK